MIFLGFSLIVLKGIKFLVNNVYMRVIFFFYEVKEFFGIDVCFLIVI